MRALIRDPAVFILDEVMSHIDAHLKFQMLFDLKAIHQEMKKTMVYVTHDQVEALALADRVAVMSNAKLQQVGDRNALYNRPANVFVADFIGEPPTNFFRARQEANGGLSLRIEDSELVLRLPQERAAQVGAQGGSDFIVGLRPQNLTLAPGDGGLPAEVLINEYLGERTILTVRNGSAQFRALVPPDTRVQRGDTVQLGYDPRDVMIFDAETEALIG